MKTVSEVTDLLDASGERHVHSKVMVLGVTALTFVLLLLIVLLDRGVTWPLALLIAAFLYAPFGLDTIKSLAKLRFGPGTDTGAAPRAIGQRRSLGVTEGVEPS